MSIADIHLVEGVFSATQKDQIIKDITDTLVKHEGEAARNTTLVIIREVKSGDWGRGGVGLTADAIIRANES
jgi:4-oxalocrotonate tautomerase